MSYAIHHDEAALRAALALAKGNYQRNILYGTEALSGATLRGKAKQYSGRYAVSARNLLARCRAAGLAIREIIGKHGKRILEIGEPAE